MASILSDYVDVSAHLPPTKPFNTDFDPSKPLEFFENALEFMAKESDFFDCTDSLMNDLNAVARRVKDKLLISEEKLKNDNSLMNDFNAVAGRMKDWNAVTRRRKEHLLISQEKLKNFRRKRISDKKDKKEVDDDKEAADEEKSDKNGAAEIKHEEAVCNYSPPHNNSPYACPYAGGICTVTGDITYLVTHLRDDHKADVHNGCYINHRYVKSDPCAVPATSWMMTVFHCFNKYFCLDFQAYQMDMAPVYFAYMRFMGDENEACKFRYSLEAGGDGRQLTWEGKPRSIRDSHVKVRDSHDGLLIPRDLALFFSGVGDNKKELKLRITGRIWKEPQH